MTREGGVWTPGLHSHSHAGFDDGGDVELTKVDARTKVTRRSVLARPAEVPEASLLPSAPAVAFAPVETGDGEPNSTYFLNGVPLSPHFSGGHSASEYIPVLSFAPQSGVSSRGPWSRDFN